jgi:hypothetical protein
VEEAEEVADAEEPRTAKPARGKAKGKRGRRGSGSSRRAPVRTPPKASAPSATVVVDPTPVVKTGSTDKHLVNDEPVEPQPVRKPRGRYDLDAIPDDYD